MQRFLLASLIQQVDCFYCQFVYGGKRHCLKLGKVPRPEADTKMNQVDYLLMRLKQGLLQLPPGSDIVAFLHRDGKTLESPSAARGMLTLKALRHHYLTTHTGALEASTIDGMRLHFRHLVRTLGEGFPVQNLNLADLQIHADRRGRMKWHGKQIAPATIRKEMVTLRTAWSWGVHMGLVTGRFPALKRVKTEKPEEKPLFLTWAEIERRLPGVTANQAVELWGSLKPA